jgi:hypothetical protein
MAPMTRFGCRKNLNSSRPVNVHTATADDQRGVDSLLAVTSKSDAIAIVFQGMPRLVYENVLQGRLAQPDRANLAGK